jgi:DNA polymerase Pol2
VIKKRQEVKQKMKKLKKGSEEYKKLDNYQYSLKIIANAMYGYFAYVASRWYCRPCGESCTAWERYYIDQIIKNAKENNFEIIYGDTDSVFIKIPNVSGKQLNEKAANWLNKVNDKLPGIIELEFRGLYQGGIFVARHGEEKGAKKRYALIDYDGNLEIRGFETVRRDWCDLAKKIQHEVLRIILQDKDPDKAIKLVKDTIKKVQDGKAKLDELTINTQLTMPISAYRQIGPHVKVAMKMEQRGKPVGEGIIIEYIITKGKGSISDRAEPVEDVKEGQYDPEYYINNQVLPAAMRVLQALELTEEQILSGKTQAKLGEWFER